MGDGATGDEDMDAFGAMAGDEVSDGEMGMGGEAEEDGGDDEKPAFLQDMQAEDNDGEEAQENDGKEELKE